MSGNGSTIQQYNGPSALLPSEGRAAFARTFSLHVGVDAGRSFHKMVARQPEKPRTAPFRIEVNRAGFDAADHFLRTKFPRVPRRRVLVGVEVGGEYGITFASYMAKKGYMVVSVLGTTTKRGRELDDNSPRKDDDKDAAQICGHLANGYFSRSMVLSEWGASLRLLVNERERYARDLRRVRTRLKRALAIAWPEFQAHFNNFGKHSVRFMLEAWPLPVDMCATDPRTVRRLVRKVSHGRIDADAVDSVRSSARQTVGLAVAREFRRAELRRLLASWNLLTDQLEAIDECLAGLIEQRPGARALLTIPAVQVVTAAHFVSALGEPADFASPRQVLKLAGLNLTQRQSGTTVASTVRISRRGRSHLRASLYWLAVRWTGPHGLYRRDYEALLVRNGGKAKKAICAIARKLVPLMLHVAKTGEPFDLERWKAAHRTA